MSEHKSRWRPTENMLSGLFFIFAAIGFYAGSQNVSMGTNFQPGPGYMPTIIAAVIFCLGLVLLVQDFASKARSEAFAMPKARPFLAVGGIFGFALLIQPAGFIIASLVLIVLACLAYGRMRLLDVALLSTVLIGACILIFVVGLGQRIALLP